MKVELKSRFNVGDIAFMVHDRGEEYGVQHTCTHCGQLHYSERYSPIVVRVRIDDLNWSVSRDGRVNCRYDYKEVPFGDEIPHRPHFSGSAYEARMFAALEEARNECTRVQEERFKQHQSSVDYVKTT